MKTKAGVDALIESRMTGQGMLLSQQDLQLLLLAVARLLASSLDSLEDRIQALERLAMATGKGVNLTP